MKLITISIVSHGQISMVYDILKNIEELQLGSDVELIITLNINEKIQIEFNKYSYPILIIKNLSPKGYGENHNNAFLKSNGYYYCIMNPDIRLEINPFAELIEIINNNTVGVCAPMVLNTNGELQNSFREFPTLFKIVKKLFVTKKNDYPRKNELFEPDWVAGMFMLFRSSVYKEISGFNENYFLYYEDVEICARIKQFGYKVVYVPYCNVIHQGQYASRKKFRYLIFHIKSMIRFLLEIKYWKKI